MTNEQAKKEAIKKAYGDKWQLVKSLTPNRKDSNDAYDLYYNGFFNSKRLKLTNGSVTDFFNSELFDFEAKWVIPKSLKGIEDNNGWFRIEPDGINLPKSGEYRWLFESGNMADFYYEPGDIMSVKATHYKTITPELKPIY